MQNQGEKTIQNTDCHHIEMDLFFRVGENLLEEFKWIVCKDLYRIHVLTEGIGVNIFVRDRCRIREKVRVENCDTK